MMGRKGFSCQHNAHWAFLAHYQLGVQSENYASNASRGLRDVLSYGRYSGRGSQGYILRYAAVKPE